MSPILALRALTPRRVGALLAATALSAVAADPAAARAVRVGAGEHGDHSRVVFNMPAPDEWSAQPIPGGVEIHLPGGYKFDARDVTRKRKAHRVIGFESVAGDDETIVRLKFNCACTGSVSGGRLLMVKVRDGAQNAGARGVAGAASMPAPKAELRTADSRAQETMGEIVTNDVIETPEAPAPDAAAANADAPRPVLDDAPEDNRLLHSTEEVLRARELLLQQLRRAADQGIISFKGDETPAAEDAIKDAAGAEEQIKADANRENPNELGARVADAIKKAMAEPEEANHGDANALGAEADPAGHGEMDKPGEMAAEAGAAHGAAEHAGSKPADAKHAPPAHGQSAAGEAAHAMAPEAPMAPLAECLENDAIDAESWLDDRPFSEALAGYRAVLYDDLNRPDADAVADLAQFYMGHLFGEEAAHAIELFNVDSPRLRLLAQLAQVMKDLPPAPDSPFARPEPCGGRHGLWQAAAVWKSDPALSVAAFEATGRELGRTPLPFRRLLGGRIARAAIAAGDPEAAAEVMLLLERSLADPTIDMLLTDAELALNEGRVVAAQANLQKVMETRGVEAPFATMRMASTLSAPADQLRARITADALSDFATQYRDTETGDQLIAAETRLRARFGDLRRALEVLQLAQARLDAAKPLFALVANEVIESQVARLEGDPEAEGAVDAIDALAARMNDLELDSLRVRLSHVLIESGTPHLVDLLVDEAVANRNPAAAAVSREAAEAAALMVPESRTAPPPSIDFMMMQDEEAKGAAEDHEAFQAAKEKALESYLAGEDRLPSHVDETLMTAPNEEARALRGLFGPPLAPHLQESGVEKISRGKRLVDEVDDDINLLKGIASDG